MAREDILRLMPDERLEVEAPLAIQHEITELRRSIRRTLDHRALLTDKLWSIDQVLDAKQRDLFLILRSLRTNRIHQERPKSCPKQPIIDKLSVALLLSSIYDKFPHLRPIEDESDEGGGE